MGMFGGEGSWYVHCKSDMRWNKSGRGFGAVTAGGPKEMKTWIKLCTLKYGEPPEDVEIGFMKD